MRTFTDQEVDWLTSNYATLGLKKCAEILNRKANVVGPKARSLGLSCRKGPAPRPYDPDAIIMAYKSIGTIEKVAKHLKVSEENVTKVLREVGISGRPTTPFEKHKKGIIIDYIENKLSYKAIGIKYSLSGDQIRYGLRRSGLVQPDRQGHYANRKSTYASWVIKYGKEEADCRWIEYKAKLIKNARRGNESPRFGKAPPQGTGNGWKGWYRGHYFRSLREVAFMLSCDDAQTSWECAERKEYAIRYIFMDKERTYRPDFVIGNELIELKPKKLHTSRLVVAKKLAAEAFCTEKGLTYRLIDIEIDTKRIKKAFEEGLIKFDRDYEERFLAYIKASA